MKEASRARLLHKYLQIFAHYKIFCPAPQWMWDGTVAVKENLPSEYFLKVFSVGLVMQVVVVQPDLVAAVTLMNHEPNVTVGK